MTRDALRLAFPREEHTRVGAWLDVLRYGRDVIVGEFRGRVAPHDWRKDHDATHWAWYAVAIEGDGPDTWTAYDGTERRGWRLEP